MRICIDVDGTICDTKLEYENYYDLVPKPNAVDTIRKLKAEGHYIIIATARGMGVYQNNLGQINVDHGLNLNKWLQKFNIPYDELHFAKPNADVYIDDKAFKFKNWNEVKNELLSN